MQVKFPPLINVEAVFAGCKLFGHETVVLELQVGKKLATISMNRSEAEDLAEALASVGISGDGVRQVSLGTVVLPKR